MLVLMNFYGMHATGGRACGQQAGERLAEVPLQSERLTHVLPLQREAEARGALGHARVLGGGLEEGEPAGLLARAPGRHLGLLQLVVGHVAHGERAREDLAQLVALAQLELELELPCRGGRVGTRTSPVCAGPWEAV